jgi:hypothetical protein
MTDEITTNPEVRAAYERFAELRPEIPPLEWWVELDLGLSRKRPTVFDLLPDLTATEVEVRRDLYNVIHLAAGFRGVDWAEVDGDIAALRQRAAQRRRQPLGEH